MERRPTVERGYSIYALVVTSEPIGDTRTVQVSLHEGDACVWSLTETHHVSHPLEPVLIGIWRVLGEAARRGHHRMCVYVDSAEVIGMLDRRIPVPPALGKHFLLARSRLNQVGRARFAPLSEAPRHPTAADPHGDGAQRSLFDTAVA